MVYSALMASVALAPAGCGIADSDANIGTPERGRHDVGGASITSPGCNSARTNIWYKWRWN
jgi:hypothetical protein